VLGLSAALVFAAAGGAQAGPPALPGRYKGKGVLETRVDEKLTARSKFEVTGILLQDGTLQLFFAEVPALPLWETRMPDGTLDTSGDVATWTGNPNDDGTPIILTGTTSPGSIKLGYDAGTLNEPGTSSAAHAFLSLSLKRVGP
jgi:hypothetical protein